MRNTWVCSYETRVDARAEHVGMFVMNMWWGRDTYVYDAVLRSWDSLVMVLSSAWIADGKN